VGILTALVSMPCLSVLNITLTSARERQRVTFIMYGANMSCVAVREAPSVVLGAAVPPDA
jgi:hypothetical protein